MPYLPVLHTLNEDCAFFRERVFTECNVTLAELGGTVVGFSAVRSGSVDHLYVEPSRRRMGVGSALLLAAMRAQRSLELWTFARNEGARHFYESHGFVALRATEGENEEHEPDVLYAWQAPVD